MTKSNYLISGLKLLTVCLISAGSLSYVYTRTKPEIKKIKEANILKLQKELLPAASSFREVSEILKEGVDPQGNVIGFVVIEKTRGHGGDIEMAVGVNKDGSVSGIKILKHKETPGLGTRVLSEDFFKQFFMKKSAQIALKKDDSKNGTIDSVTGATITSRAVTNGVREAISKTENSK